ncbi:MAG: hypothetical protein BLM47_01525 [Candidatus Reconcilbacillus cellulovorans]|uniref:Core-binding (CB) domain-containing protein n=1 Tax=Candidatus Reconcilbacillus cellulovorans TaxID=1906605 RepID=A0A2A6E3A2_9BACL|nr:MAG: hypothetical protein BLM47_01525 [Candidatus Reconcilbacillus cellulovorans]
MDYRKHVSRFFEEFPTAWPDYNALKKAVVYHFASLQGKSSSHYNLWREYLKAFFSWCVQEGYLTKNPVDSIKKRKNKGSLNVAK